MKRIKYVHKFIYHKDQRGETQSKISVYISNILTSHERTREPRRRPAEVRLLTQPPLPLSQRGRPPC